MQDFSARRRLAAACALFSAFLLPLAAQSGYAPSNPITPPTVSPPTMAPMPVVTPPVVTAPDAVVPAANTAAPSTAPAAASKASGSAVSALSLLGLDSDNSLLNALTGSKSDGDSLDALSGLLGTSSSSTDSATLSKILALLEKQQAEAKSASAANTAVSASVTGGSVAGVSGSVAVLPERSRIESGGEIVRFTVNGSSIAAGTTALVSSILAKDGSFLLTGDRTYLSSNRPLTETFYLLCRRNPDGTYRLHADVSQNTPNEYSFLYRLARAASPQGVLTGDLLVFRTSDSDLKLDLVIRIISPTEKGASVR